MIASPDFDHPDLARLVETLSADQLDRLPYGIIRLDQDGVVQIYNRTRSEESGRGGMPTIGLSYFDDIAPCLNNGYFKGRIEKARAAGELNIHFQFIGDFNDRDRELDVRVQAAKDGGTWIFIKVP